jgi:hypothetical protein
MQHNQEWEAVGLVRFTFGEVEVIAPNVLQLPTVYLQAVRAIQGVEPEARA